MWVFSATAKALRLSATQETDDAIDAQLWGDVAVWKAYNKLIQGHYKQTQKHSSKTSASGKTPAKRGRPKGSKDKQPRKTKKEVPSIQWIYSGEHKDSHGPQKVAAGSLIVVDILGKVTLLSSRMNEENKLKLKVEKKAAGSDATAEMEVDPSLCRSHSEAGPSTATEPSTAIAPKPPATRKSKGRKLKVRSAQELQALGLTPQATRKEIREAQKRKQREKKAIEKGKPLKEKSAQQKKSWDPALVGQALSIWDANFAATKSYTACTKHLQALPGFKHVTPGHLQGWIQQRKKRAEHTPNEYGLIKLQLLHALESEKPMLIPCRVH